MTTLAIALIVIAVIAIFAILWIIGGYNSLVIAKAHVDEGFSGIDVQLKRRTDLIPNLVAVVKQYGVHEKEVLENVTRMRSAVMHATDVSSAAQAATGLNNALKTLFAVAESYPDLKANQNFLQLQKDLKDIEDQIQLARRYYNGSARNYNILVSRFPTVIIANMTGFSKVAYFETDSADRNVPKVSF